MKSYGSSCICYEIPPISKSSSLSLPQYFQPLQNLCPIIIFCLPLFSPRSCTILMAYGSISGKLWSGNVRKPSPRTLKPNHNDQVFSPSCPTQRPLIFGCAYKFIHVVHLSSWCNYTYGYFCKNSNSGFVLWYELQVILSRFIVMFPCSY